jgi:hypothetical protein
MLKAIWKNPTKKGTHAYRVKGTVSEIEEFIENNGDQTIFENDDESKPLFFTRRLTKEGPLVWNEENQRYDIEITFESAVLMQAAAAAYSAPSSTTTSKSEKEEEGDDEDAAIEPAPKKKKSVLKR